MSTPFRFSGPGTHRPRQVLRWAMAGRSIPALTSFVGGVLLLPVLVAGLAYAFGSDAASALMHTLTPDTGVGGGPDLGGSWSAPIAGAALLAVGGLLVLYGTGRLVRRRRDR
ncbi:hypothetical protein [Embleya sp. NPDC020630]|uniref:hypothetical protein n=1 Tax=Embleya sp. NPDC020630 TaxID=3363979 RepID=UPI0037A11321